MDEVPRPSPSDGLLGEHDPRATRTADNWRTAGHCALALPGSVTLCLRGRWIARLPEGTHRDLHLMCPSRTANGSGQIEDGFCCLLTFDWQTGSIRFLHYLFYIYRSSDFHDSWGQPKFAILPT